MIHRVRFRGLWLTVLLSDSWSGTPRGRAGPAGLSGVPWGCFFGARVGRVVSGWWRWSRGHGWYGDQVRAQGVERESGQGQPGSVGGERSVRAPAAFFSSAMSYSVTAWWWGSGPL